ncbi:hypothetical protein DOY81_011392, partial [Sarcophaga bullata]
SVTWQANQIDAANILGLFTSHSPSHLIVHMSLVKALAEKGHNVTVVVSQVPKVKHDKINMIIIPPTKQQEETINKGVSAMATKKIAAKFNAPLVISWMGPPMLFTDILTGNPNEVSYVPDMNIAVKAGEKMTLQRLQNLLSNIFFKLVKQVLDFKMRSFYNELYPNDGSFPSLSDMEKNVSLVFCNGHFSEGPIRPNVPAVIEIGGIQVKEKPDPLPKDIVNFLDSANETGAILFSLGSNLKGSSIKPETATHIFNVLSTLKQKVIWKWEDLENTPGRSPNILYKKWMPQDDILAHPNIKLFILPMLVKAA